MPCPPPSPAPLSPSSPPQCKDEDPPFCKETLKTDKDKLMNCKKQEFKDKCREACGYCPPSGAATVVTTVTAFGSIADYPEVHQGEIKQNFATAANVDASVVDIDVQSGSVIITFTIPVTTQEAALALRTMLFAKIGTAAQATAVLGADIYEDPTFDIMIGSPSQPSDAATTANLLTASSEADGSGSTMALIGGVVAAVGLLALLLLASRPSTRAFVRSVAGKAFGSAGSVQSTAAGQNPPITASTSAANASPGKGVLLDSSVRQRSGLSWFRPSHVQLLAAPEQDGESEASAWSALVLDGVTVPHEEVAGVQANESTLEFIIELKPRSSTPLPYTHVRMFTRAEFNLWREALNAEINNSTLHVETKDKPSAVHAAQKWLANTEVVV